MAVVEHPVASAAESALKSAPMPAKSTMAVPAAIVPAEFLSHFFPMLKHISFSDLSKIYRKIYRNTSEVKRQAGRRLFRQHVIITRVQKSAHPRVFSAASSLRAHAAGAAAAAAA
jgi:hypothetical protein